MAGSAIGGHGKEPDWTVEERSAKIASVHTGVIRGGKGLKKTSVHFFTGRCGGQNENRKNVLASGSWGRTSPPGRLHFSDYT